MRDNIFSRVRKKKGAINYSMRTMVKILLIVIIFIGVFFIFRRTSFPGYQTKKIELLNHGCIEVMRNCEKYGEEVLQKTEITYAEETYKMIEICKMNNLDKKACLKRCECEPQKKTTSTSTTIKLSRCERLDKLSETKLKDLLEKVKNKISCEDQFSPYKVEITTPERVRAIYLFYLLRKKGVTPIDFDFREKLLEEFFKYMECDKEKFKELSQFNKIDKNAVVGNLAGSSYKNEVLKFLNSEKVENKRLLEVIGGLDYTTGIYISSLSSKWWALGSLGEWASKIDAFKLGCVKLLKSGCTSKLDNIKVDFSPPAGAGAGQTGLGKEKVSLSKMCSDWKWFGFDLKTCKNYCGCDKLTNFITACGKLQAQCEGALDDKVGGKTVSEI